MTANTTNVAQAISFAIDEVQEFSQDGGLFMVPDSDSDLRVTEVGAELESCEPDETSGGRPYSQFKIKTSDGQEWTVRVTPA